MRNGQVGVLQNVLVLLLSDEIAAGKECGRIASVLQFVAHFFIGDPQAQPLGFGDQGFRLIRFWAARWVK